MWTVILGLQFDLWLREQEEGLQEKVLSALGRLEYWGPALSRPWADTVKRSHHRNMKELRVQYGGRPIRVFYAFDPVRRAVVLCAGDKRNDKQFYNTMIRIADDAFSAHLQTMEDEQ